MDGLNSFIEDYLDRIRGVISWSSFIQPATFHRKGICTIIREFKGKKFVEFTFAE